MLINTKAAAVSQEGRDSVNYRHARQELQLDLRSTFGPKSAAKPTLLNIIIINMQKSSRTLFVGLFKPVIIRCSHVLTNRAQLVPLSSPPNTKHKSSNVLVFSSAGANRENKKHLARLRETEACRQHFLASPAETLQGKSGHQINNLIYESLYSVRFF